MSSLGETKIEMHNKKLGSSMQMVFLVFGSINDVSKESTKRVFSTFGKQQFDRPWLSVNNFLKINSLISVACWFCSL